MATQQRPLKAVDIFIGHIYEAKRPASTGSFLDPLVNDRQVRWINSTHTELQYDSPTVKVGRHLPKVSMLKFLAWAARDVTDEMPPKAWRGWDTKAHKPKKKE